MEVVGPADVILLHQGHPESLGDPAMDLPLDQQRVDRAADVMRSHDPADHGRAQLHVHIDDRDLSPEPVGLIRDALAVRVELGGVRVVRARPDEHAAILVFREQRQIRSGHFHQAQQVFRRKLRGIA